jgi:hypothetical protein
MHSQGDYFEGDGSQNWVFWPSPGTFRHTSYRWWQYIKYVPLRRYSHCRQSQIMKVPCGLVLAV